MAIFRIPVLVVMIAAMSFAQMQPQSAHVNLFFPHLADGGPANQKWQTTFTFVNTGFSNASVTLHLYADNGSPLSLDFGSGAVSDYQFDIPAGGTRVLRSQSTSNEIVVGWAAALSTVPVMGTVAFRYFVNGVPRQEMSAQPTLPTIMYNSPANSLLGVALANVNSTQDINVLVDLLDSNGQPWGNGATVTVPAGGHHAFKLSDLEQDIGKKLDDFSGSLILSAADPRYDEFMAWTVSSDNQGIFSTLPPGATAFPISHWDRIELVYYQMLEAAQSLTASTQLLSAPELSIISDRVVNAFAKDGKTLGVSLGLSQLISDSPGELAFVVAHELAHIYQQQNGPIRRNPRDPENDADLWATLIMLQAGYDPYSISGALAKIQLAIGAKMTSGFDNLDNAAALQSVNARLGAAFDTLQTACMSSPQQCDYYKSAIHPNLPRDSQVAPMSVRPRPALSTSGAGVRSPAPLRSRPVAR